MNQSNQINSVQMKIAELQDMILASHPKLPILLKEIHTILKNDPDNVTIPSDEEIGIIVSGLKKQTATEISASTMKKSSAALKRATIADDL